MGLYASRAQWDQLSNIVYFLGTTFRNEEDHALYACQPLETSFREALQSLANWDQSFFT